MMSSSKKSAINVTLCLLCLLGGFAAGWVVGFFVLAFAIYANNAP